MAEPDVEAAGARRRSKARSDRPGKSTRVIGLRRAAAATVPGVEPETVEFERVRVLFESLIELPDEQRAQCLDELTPALAAELRELLGIADREAHADAALRVLDARGRGLCLLREDRIVWKLFRVPESRVEAARTLLADWSQRVASLQPHPVLLPVHAAGLATGNTGWFATTLLPGARDLPSVWPALTDAQRRSHAVTLRELFAEAVASGLPEPLPAPRQLLLDSGDRLRVTDLGLTAALAAEPETGETLPVESARALLAPYLEAP